MRLTRADLPALRDIVAQARPILPAQAVVLHEIVQEIFLASDPYETQFKVPGTDRMSGEPTSMIVEAPTAAKAAEIAGKKIDVGKVSNVKATTGFLGILMDDGGRSDVGAENDGNYPIGVIVADRIPGFCASRYLLDGDIILGLSSPFTPFRSRLDLTGAVGGSPPGTVVGLLVLRRGQIISVTLTLDPKPAVQLLEDNGVIFRNDRQRKFDAYWQANFKSLLSQQLG
jgi:hypothetical protein